MENLFLAWREFRRGKRNKRDVQEFEVNLEDNIFALHRNLSSGQYRHSNYTPFFVTDPKLRHIHKASITDRLVHHAIFRVLYPVFDKSFIFDSYSCRLGKGTHKGVVRLSSFARKLSSNSFKNVYCLKCDITRFFDSVDQNILYNLIGQKIVDQSTLSLITKIINSFEKANGKGIPLGNVTSQLFANIYLNELDQFIKHKLKIQYYLRYCDDFIILSDRREYLRVILPRIRDFLEFKLKLQLHPRKIILRKFSQGFDFLGYVVLPDHIVLRTKTKRRMFRKINSLNKESYLGLLKHCNSYKLKTKITDSLDKSAKIC